MGLDANYPAVTMNDPNGHVTVYNQDHEPIGQLGPPPYESASVNVVCKLKGWDEIYWYRLLNPRWLGPPGHHRLRLRRGDPRAQSWSALLPSGLCQCRLCSAR
jgi:hypothetical protein